MIDAANFDIKYEIENLGKFEKYQKIIVINKIDLVDNERIENIKEIISNNNPQNIVNLSLVTQRGIKDLEKEITNLFYHGDIEWMKK